MSGIVTEIWGPATHANSYHALLEGERCFLPPSSLECYTLRDPDYQTTDMVEITCVKLVNGQMLPTTEVIRPELVYRVNWTLQVPVGKTIWSLIDQYQETACSKDIILVYLCPEKPEYEHFFVLPNVKFGSKRREGVWVEGGDTANAPHIQTVPIYPNGFEKLYYYLYGKVVQDLANPVTAVTFDMESCFNCQKRYVNGSYGTSDDVYNTSNRFVTGTAASPTLPALSIVTDNWQNGDMILVTYADTNDPTTATTGGIAVTFDGGANWVDVSVAGNAPVEPYQSIAYGNGYWVVVGEGGTIAYSIDGYNFTAVTNTVVAGADFYQVVFSPGLQEFLMVGVNAGAGVVLRLNLPSTLLLNLTADITGAAGQALTAIHASGDWVAIAGASGYWVETDRIGYDEEWTENVLPGTGTVRVVLGDCTRPVVARGAFVYARSVLNANKWKKLTTVNTVTGDYISGAQADSVFSDGWYVFGTDDGEIVVFYPPFPNA